MKILKNVLAFFQKRAIVTIFKNSAEGVLIISHNGLVEWANQTVKAKTELEGKHIADIIGKDHVWPPRIEEPIRRQIESRLVEYVTTPLIKGYLTTVRELNSKNGIVSEMEEKHNGIVSEMEEKHNGIVSEIERKNVRQTGQIIHDLKAPLNAVLGFTRLSIESLEEKNYQEVKEYLQHIAGAGDTILKDIESYLSFVRLQNGVGEIKKEMINLNEIAESAKKIIEVGFRWQSIVVDVDSNNTIVEGDYSLLKNAIINALKNAAEATSECGHVNLKIIETKSLVKIIIINSGHISEENLKKIFHTTFSTKNGNGMGTQMIKMVAEAHHGNVIIENIEEQVVLTITLPKVQ